VEKRVNRAITKLPNCNSHTSKIGYLLSVCLRSKRCWADHVSEPHAKFCENL